jgi:lysophospholipase L1-like esterase
MPMANAPRYYAALGDSMSIDAYAGGPGRGAPALLLRNRDDDFPEWRDKDLATRFPSFRLLPLAMDGATSATVRYAQVPRLKEMNVRPDVVTLTMGGNDLLQTFGSPAAAHAARRALWDNGHAALADLRTLVGSGAPILVGTIYDPSDGTGDAERLGIGSWPDAVAWIAQFNETLRALASEHGAFVADIHGRFLGHGLRAGQPAQADPRPADRNLWYCGVIEPNAWGAGAIRAVFWELLEQAGVLEP